MLEINDVCVCRGFWKTISCGILTKNIMAFEGHGVICRISLELFFFVFFCREIAGKQGAFLQNSGEHSARLQNSKHILMISQHENAATSVQDENSPSPAT